MQAVVALLARSPQRLAPPDPPGDRAAVPLDTELCHLCKHVEVLPSTVFSGPDAVFRLCRALQQICLPCPQFLWGQAWVWGLSAAFLQLCGSCAEHGTRGGGVQAGSEPCGFPHPHQATHTQAGGGGGVHHGSYVPSIWAVANRNKNGMVLLGSWKCAPSLIVQ